MMPTAPIATAANRVVLVPVADRSDAVVRRYRLARLRLEDRDARERADRFSHLKRSYD